jgi:hypothetical protein
MPMRNRSKNIIRSIEPIIAHMVLREMMGKEAVQSESYLRSLWLTLTSAQCLPEKSFRGS